MSEVMETQKANSKIQSFWWFSSGASMEMSPANLEEKGLNEVNC